MAGPTPEADRSDHDELLALEHEGWQALCTGADAGADHYAAVMSEGAVMVLADGSTRARDEVVESLRAAQPWDTYSIHESTVARVTDDVRALTYRASGHRGPDAFTGTLTSVYVRSPEGWRLALHQQTAG